MRARLVVVRIAEVHVLPVAEEYATAARDVEADAQDVEARAVVTVLQRAQAHAKRPVRRRVSALARVNVMVRARQRTRQ